MSDSKPLSDAPLQQATHNDLQAARDARAKQEAADDAAAVATEQAHAAAIEADKSHDKAFQPPAAAMLDQGIGGTGVPPATEADAQTEQAVMAEEAKAHRAEHGLTAAANGDPAGTAFGPLIDAAKFDLRNLGHNTVTDLLDALLAGLHRLEARLADQIKR